MAAQRPQGAGPSSKHWEHRLQAGLRAPAAIPRKGDRRRWFVGDVEVKDSQDWFVAAQDLGKWHLGGEKGMEESDEA